MISLNTCSREIELKFGATARYKHGRFDVSRRLRPSTEASPLVLEVLQAISMRLNRGYTAANEKKSALWLMNQLSDVSWSML